MRLAPLIVGFVLAGCTSMQSALDAEPPANYRELVVQRARHLFLEPRQSQGCSNSGADAVERARPVHDRIIRGVVARLRALQRASFSATITNPTLSL